jgi:hypothetical protein
VKLNQGDFSEVEGTFYSPKVNELLNASWVGAIFWDTYIGDRAGCAAPKDEIPWPSSNSSTMN